MAAIVIYLMDPAKSMKNLWEGFTVLDAIKNTHRKRAKCLHKRVWKKLVSPPGRTGGFKISAEGVTADVEGTPRGGELKWSLTRRTAAEEERCLGTNRHLRSEESHSW